MAEFANWPDNEEDELELIIDLDARFEAEETLAFGKALTETQRDWCVVFRPDLVPWLCCPNLLMPIEGPTGEVRGYQEMVDRSWWYTFIRPLLAERGVRLHHPKYLCDYPGDYPSDY